MNKLNPRSKQCLRGKYLNEKNKVFNCKGFEPANFPYRVSSDVQILFKIFEEIGFEGFTKMTHKENFCVVYRREKPRTYYQLRKYLREVWLYDFKIIGDVFIFKPISREESLKPMKSKVLFDVEEN